MRLTHRNIYILPTGRGLALGLVVILGLVGVINYQLSLGFFFVFLLAGVAIAALFHTWVTLLGLTVQVMPPSPVFCGETARFPLLLEDDAGRSRYRITVLAPNGESAHAVPIWQGSTVLPMEIATTHRGILSLPRLRIECRAPIGWFMAWSHLSIRSQCVVYPCPEENPPPLPTGNMPAENASAIAAGDEEFTGLREYRPGDSPRRIAWKQLARSDQLLTRHLQSPAATEVVLDWNALAYLAAEARLSRLAAWVLAAEAAGTRYALILPGFDQPAGLGPEHRDRCLHALAVYPAGRDEHA